MRIQSIAMIACSLLLLANTSFADNNILTIPTRHLSEAIGLNTGHNLGNNFIRHHGIKTTRDAKLARRAANASETEIFFESFESCSQLSEQMPEGWITESRGETAGDGEDHWMGFTRQYANRFMFAPPKDGDMMVGVLYNDDIRKDEWLISPALKIDADGYILSFYWYTVPVTMYAVDQNHVNFDDRVFTNREVIFNFEVYAKTADSDWAEIFDLESCFSDKDYDELAEINYTKMQRADVNLSEYAGKEVQFAFRYYGKAGNSLFMDAVSVDKTAPTISYIPHFSRLFYGFDNNINWIPASIEFYPVNHPVYWENDSKDRKEVDFGWLYCNSMENGQPVWSQSNDSDLEVTFRPDYSSPETLVNNVYPLPVLVGAKRNGGTSTYADSYDMLQAGGTTEAFITSVDGEENTADDPQRVKFTALNFDIISERIGIHAEDDDDLGFFQEPVFGYSVNTDEWWKHHTMPEREPADVYAYVDGFANMYFPHPSAPMVVNGVTVAANGEIYDDATFTAKVYTITLFEDRNGDVLAKIVEEPIAQKTIKGSEVTSLSSGSTRKYLVLDFEFDQPVIFSTEGTEYAYIVEISGYHDEKIRYFAPLQSLVPNKHEWSLSFYHLYSSLDEIYNYNDFTSGFGYVSDFKDDYGNDLCCSFAIGLDAHYPWLELADPDDPFTYGANGSTSFMIKGYYDKEDYEVIAPESYKVELEGERYLTKVTIEPRSPLGTDEEAKIKIEAPGVDLAVDVPMKASSAIKNLLETEKDMNVYNAQGILIGSKAAGLDLQDLPTGIYIVGGKKILHKH